METEDKRFRIRIAVGSALITLGIALMVVAMQFFRLEPAPWWAILSIIIAIIAIVAGFIIVTGSWKRIRDSIFRFPKGIYKACLWKVYKLKWNISEPAIETYRFTDIRDPQYKARFTVSIKNGHKPLKVDFRSSKVIIKQDTVWDKNFVEIGNFTSQAAIMDIKPNKELRQDIDVHTVPGRQHIDHPPDLQQPYDWGIQGIYVELPKAGRKELHIGIYHKPRPQKILGPI